VSIWGLFLSVTKQLFIHISFKYTPALSLFGTDQMTLWGAKLVSTQFNSSHSCFDRREKRQRIVREDEGAVVGRQRKEGQAYSLYSACGPINT
jgi:hypothetical protein